MIKKLTEEKRIATIAALAELGVVLITPEELEKLDPKELAIKLTGIQDATVLAVAEILDQTDKLVVDLKSQIDSKETEIKLKKPVVKIGNKKYQVNTPKFRLGSEIHEYGELESNSKLAKEVLDIQGQNILEELK
jgi:hypothetical protein